MSTSYIGADVDCKMTELAVERNRQIVRRARVASDIRSIRGFLEGIDRPKAMVIEEGPMAGWLYRNLCGDVDRLVVCDPCRNRWITFEGDKSDATDAEKLAGLLRGGYLREVYHTEDEGRLALKEAVGLYHDRVREAVRQINKLRGRCRCHGLSIPRIVLRSPLRREDWLNGLDCRPLVRQLRILYLGLDTALEQVKRARREVLRLSRPYPVIGLWRDIPGVGPIRAATFFAYLDTPWRFDSPKKLYRYCGVGLRRWASGSNDDGTARAGYLRLDRAVNRRLKDAILGAALSAILHPDNPFAVHYRRMIRQGVTPSNARHTVARKLLRVMWGMWKTTRRYDESLV